MVDEENDEPEEKEPKEEEEEEPGGTAGGVDGASEDPRVDGTTDRARGGFFGMRNLALGFMKTS